MTTIDHAAAAHAVYAPSAAHVWVNCTASAEAIARLPEQEEGEEAAEGTAAHEEIDRCLGDMNGIEVDAKTFAELVKPVDPEHPAAYGIALVLDYVRKLVTASPGFLLIEQRVQLTEQIWGRCDVAHYSERERVLTITDYKNGFVPVDAEENEQLRIYAGGSAFTHKFAIDHVRYAVVQPNDFRPVPRVKQWSESADNLHRFLDGVARIPGGPKKFVAGEHCRYCPLFGRCEATRDVLVHLGTMLANPPDAVRPDQVAKFLACKKPIEDWFKALEKAQLKEGVAGRPAPGMKVVEGQTHRTWKDAAAARAMVLERLGPDKLDPPTPAQAEKLGIPSDVVAALAHKPQGAPVLAFESDRRPAWAQKSAAEMFASVLAPAK
jgi:hypothetical protein